MTPPTPPTPPPFAWPAEGLPPWLPERTIFLTRHGSHAYGLATPTSDLDVRGVAIAPRASLLGFGAVFEQGEASEPDLVVYDLRKFMRLAAACNPNIIEVLWTDPGDHLHVHPLGARLIAAREAFLSRKARHTFAGYAASQLKRIQRHHRWLKEPPQAAPTRAEFDLPERTLIPQDQLLAAERRVEAQLEAWLPDLDDLDEAARIAVQAQLQRALAEMALGADEQWRAAARCSGMSEDFIALMDRERKYRGRQRAWSQYQRWKRERNPDRARLEASHGYDVKHAQHLCRLLVMCRELLERGEVVVRRPDHAWLRSIRAGAWSYEELIAWAQEQNDALDALAARSPLPRAPDRARLDALCVELHEAALGGAL